MSTLAKHAVLVAKVEKTLIICVRELKAATNCAGFHCTVVTTDCLSTCCDERSAYCTSIPHSIY
jgi:hypothetical protein